MHTDDYFKMPESGGEDTVSQLNIKQKVTKKLIIAESSVFIFSKLFD